MARSVSGRSVDMSATTNAISPPTRSSTATIPPMPIEITVGSPVASSADNPITTARPEKAIALPAWVTISTAASATDLPARRSERNRVIMNRA